MAYLINPETSAPVPPPETLARRRKLADSLLASSVADSGPIQSWSQGAARLANAVVANLASQKVSDDEARGQRSASDAIGSLVSAMSGGSSGGNAADAIASIESGGRYDATGPVTKTGDRAYGKYQVMGANIGPWSKEAIGRSVTPQEFLADPKIQDAVFNRQFGRYMSKYGPAGAASMWFTGRPSAPNATDVNGMTGGRYVDRFMKAFNGAPTQGTDNSPDLGRLLTVAQNPYLNDSQRGIVEALLKQKFAEADPLRQLQIGKARIDLQNAENPKPDYPSSVKEYQFYAQAEQAAGRAPLSYNDWQLQGKKAGATTVNVGPNGEQFGNPGEGLAWVRNPDGTIKVDERGVPVAAPYQGGKVFQAQQDAAEKEKATKDQADTGANVVVQDVDRALAKIKASPGATTGLGGALLKNIPASQAYDVDALVSTIKANAAFDKLQAMRNASPTGGALGNVSDKEGALLAAAIGNLEQAQSAEQFTDNLRRVKNIYLDIIHGQGNGPPRDPLSFEASKVSPDIDALLKKYGH